MKTRCKLRLDGVFAQQWGGVKAVFRAEYDPALCAEDHTFAKATPNGLAEFTIDNPAVYPMLVIGKSYYFDITQVPEPAPLPKS